MIRRNTIRIELFYQLKKHLRENIDRDLFQNDNEHFSLLNMRSLYILKNDPIYIMNKPPSKCLSK